MQTFASPVYSYSSVRRKQAGLALFLRPQVLYNIPYIVVNLCILWRMPRLQSLVARTSHFDHLQLDSMPVHRSTLPNVRLEPAR